MNLKVFMQDTASNWLDSLRLFKPQAFKLFMLVTLKTYIESLKHFVHMFWWLLPVVIGLVALSMTQLALDYATLYITLTTLLSVAIFLTLFLTIRPSVARKDYTYYRSYIPSMLFALVMYYLGYMVVFVGMLFLLIHQLPDSIQALLGFFFKYGLLMHIELIFSPLLLLILFFYTDSARSAAAFMRSIQKGLIFLWRNYPLLLISNTVLMILFYGSTIGVMMLLRLAPLPLITMRFGVMILEMIIWYPFILAYYNNLYIKRVYDQVKAYTEQ